MIIPFSFSRIEVNSLAESAFPELLAQFSEHKKVIVVDENTHDFCLEYLITTFSELKDAEVILLPAGEENKVMEVCYQVWQALTEYGITRHDLVINLGGGVVTDTGGFIASIYKRGLNFVHLPTTVLAMVDAAIGGKNGVDMDGLKNQLGVFRHPSHIFIDLGFLETLPREEFVNGLAEMLKHALITGTSEWQKMLELIAGKDELLSSCIASSAAIKCRVVEQDPEEKGLRKILNYGHTLGHALESHFLMNVPISHGIAVIHGMRLENYIAVQKGFLPQEMFIEIDQVLSQIVAFPPIDEFDISQIISIAKNDKKNTSSAIRCVLLKTIGEPLIDVSISEDEIRAALVWSQGSL